MLKRLIRPQRATFRKTQTRLRVKHSIIVCGECGIYTEDGDSKPN
jgi:hypothetical protein